MCGFRSVAPQAIFARVRERLVSAILHRRRDAHATAQLRDRNLAPQPFKNNPDLFLRQVPPPLCLGKLCRDIHLHRKAPFRLPRAVTFAEPNEPAKIPGNPPPKPRTCTINS
jgi:hypothetical protein